MSAPTAAYMAGVTAHLDIDDGLDVAFGNVPVTVWEESDPQGAKSPRRFPYVQLYTIDREPLPQGCGAAWQMTLTVQAWDKRKERARVRAIAEALAQALDRPFAITGWRVRRSQLVKVSDGEDPQSGHVFGGVIVRHEIVAAG